MLVPNLVWTKGRNFLKSTCESSSFFPFIHDSHGRVYIDSTLYYYGTENESEAYYICGMLNISDLYRSVKLISDTRHHHKRPLYFNIPKFQNTIEYLEISNLSKNCIKLVEDYVLNKEKIKEQEINESIKENLEKIQEIRIDGVQSGVKIKDGDIIGLELFIFDYWLRVWLWNS